MIQRIQTVYLLLSTLLLALIFLFPLAGFHQMSGGIVQLNYKGFVTLPKGDILFRAYPVMALVFINILLNLFTIFQFKNRKLQIRICIYNIIAMIGLFGLVYYYYKIGVGQIATSPENDVVSSRMLWASLLPVLAAFFTYLAFKGIRRDEALIKSIDRLR
jgi:hypothetical protein